MRLGILETGHAFGKKALMLVIRVVSRQAVPSVLKTLFYRPEFFGGQMSPLFQAVMRGPSEWAVGERELMASFVSKTNECEF
jgi:hypothetical protein